MQKGVEWDHLLEHPRKRWYPDIPPALRQQSDTLNVLFQPPAVPAGERGLGLPRKKQALWDSDTSTVAHKTASTPSS